MSESSSLFEKHSNSTLLNVCIASRGSNLALCKCRPGSKQTGGAAKTKPNAEKLSQNMGSHDYDAGRNLSVSDYNIVANLGRFIIIKKKKKTHR